MLKENGLLAMHSYGILAVARVPNKLGKVVKLVKMRNPWGNFEWNGKWSDKSDEWTPELKKKLQLEVKDDGIFWIDFDEAKFFFSEV